MFKILHSVEANLATLLTDASKWQSIDVNYHPPRVERLWMQYGENRIMLHGIHHCTTEEALFHPHPWPSAMRIVSGTYEMAVGYGKGDEVPPTAATIILPPGAEYEMVDPDGWHYVRPVDGVVYTLMVIGKPWDRKAPKSTEPLKPLPELRKEEILNIFFRYYKPL